MDQRNQEDEAERETPADEGRCQTCKRAACATVVTLIIILVMGLGLCLALLETKKEKMSAPELQPQASAPSVRELLDRLHQCQKERQDRTLMLRAATRDSRSRLCPDGWCWWRGRCYFFSVGLKEDRQWDESVEFCQQHNSSLIVIQDSAEMEFIQSVMRSLPKFPFLWVGLTDAQQEGQWLWWDGTDIQHYMQLTVEWDSDHRDCADLRGGGSLFASDCDDYGPWMCKKDS